MSKLVNLNPSGLPAGHFTASDFEAPEGARPISELKTLTERDAFMSAMAMLKKKNPRGFDDVLAEHRAKSWSHIAPAAYAKITEKVHVMIGTKAITEMPVRDALAVLADQVYGR